MLFSCKISNSILSFLDRHGAELLALDAQGDLPPMEFLKDPSYWLEAERMEALLQMTVQLFAPTVESDLLPTVGHQCRDLRSWGALDSVLRMLKTPQDIFHQPERFLSYFISPAPPLGVVTRFENAMEFDIPISPAQYPLTCLYLKSAFEAVPTFFNKPLAHVEWEDFRVSIRWNESQVSLLGDQSEADGSVLGPELVETIVSNLESSQHQLQESNRLLLEKEREIQELRVLLEDVQRHQSGRSQSAVHAMASKSDFAKPERTTFSTSLPKSQLDMDLLSVNASPGFVSELATAVNVQNLATHGDQRVMPLGESTDAEILQPMMSALNQIYRLNDYLGRAQQLITLLVGQGRQTPQVKEAMRRVDWSIVLAESGSIAKQATQDLKRAHGNVSALVSSTTRTAMSNSILQASGLSTPASRLSGSEQSRSQDAAKFQMLGPLIYRAIERFQKQHPEFIKIDRQLLLDKTVFVSAVNFENLLLEIFEGSHTLLAAGTGSAQVMIPGLSLSVETNEDENGNALLLVVLSARGMNQRLPAAVLAKNVIVQNGVLKLQGCKSRIETVSDREQKLTLIWPSSLVQPLLATPLSGRAPELDLN